MTSSNSRPSSGLFQTLWEDIRTVSADIQQRGIRRVVGEGFSSLESFYLTEEDRRRLAGKRPVRRFFIRSWWLLKSLLLKLTPARRILLALGLWFLIVGGQHFRIDSKSFNIDIRLPYLSSVLLLGVLMLELKDKLVARDELEAGRKVQLALMPEESPAIPGWDVWLYTRPANDVGGDLVDHLQIDDRHHAIALGDVAGKALPAALLSVKLQATLRALAPRFDGLAELGGAVNNILHRDGLPTRYASLVYLLLSPDSNRIRVLNAGHMPPLVVRNGSISAMERGSMVLGIMHDAPFSEQAIDLVDGDTLVVYSDGVTEAQDEKGDFFGDERLYGSIRAGADLNPAQTGRSILTAVKEFIRDAVPSDDLSLVVLRRTR
jgi:phosphoserine phosphatase RsbU/P